MIETLLALPTMLGCLIFMVLTTAVGLLVYVLTYQFIVKRQPPGAMSEIKDATGNLFRVIGWLFSLLLSLTFTEVAKELTVIETAIEHEAAAISDTHHNLRRLDTPQARAITPLLADYADAAINADGPALASNRLSPEATAALRKLEDALLHLEVADPAHKIVQSRIFQDVDMISDYRLSRLQQAQGQPPTILLVVFFGYLVTMVCFGVYQPYRGLLALVMMYTAFVGLVLYLVIAMSDPFQGATSVDLAPLQYALDAIRGGAG